MKDSASQDDVRQAFIRLGFVTSSQRMMPLLCRAQKAAEVSDVTVLLEGETGTGKQVLAQSIHKLDKKRGTFAFVTVHCSTITEALAESELFGHRRGSFSGAILERKGLFQSAQQGTLFLDDINDLPANLQPKLLDVIQRGTVRSVGSDRETPIDVRIIAASNQPLQPLVKQGRFRSDLYHRLNVVKLVLPPLRERKEDFSTLILTFAERHKNLYAPIEEIAPELVDFLRSQVFLGNIRELENAVQKMLFAKARGRSLGMDDWFAQTEQENADNSTDFLAEAASAVWNAVSLRGLSYGHVLQQVEKKVLEAALKVDGSTRRQIAEQLHTSERTLYHKIRAYKINRPAS